MQRDRNTTEPAVLYSYTGTGFGGWGNSSGTVWKEAYESSYELFDEGTLPRSRKVDNYCYHRRHVRLAPTGTFVFGNGPSNSSYVSYSGVPRDTYWLNSVTNPITPSGQTRYGYDGMTGLWNSSSPPSDYLDLEPWHDAAYAAILPRIKPKLSVLNSLFELKDFRRLPALLAKTKQLYLSAPQALRKINRKATLQQVTGLSAEHYLNYSFNLGPLLSELTSLRTIVASVDEQIKKLLEDENKVLRAHFSREIPGYVVNQTDTSSLDSGFLLGNKSQRIVTVLEPLKFHAVVEYSYVIPSFFKKDLRSRALMDAYGLNWNPAIIWNAIPWSFVIDWVIGVNRWLDQFKASNIGLQTGIRRYCYSLRYARSVDCNILYGQNSGAPISGTVTARRYQEYVYERRPLVPNLYRQLTLSGLNLKEFSYIGALALTRTNPDRHRLVGNYFKP
jgi:hypothetical protein